MKRICITCGENMMKVCNNGMLKRYARNKNDKRETGGEQNDEWNRGDRKDRGTMKRDKTKENITGSSQRYNRNCGVGWR